MADEGLLGPGLCPPPGEAPRAPFVLEVTGEAALSLTLASVPTSSPRHQGGRRAGRWGQGAGLSAPPPRAGHPPRPPPPMQEPAWGGGLLIPGSLGGGSGRVPWPGRSWCWTSVHLEFPETLQPDCHSPRTRLSPEDGTWEPCALSPRQSSPAAEVPGVAVLVGSPVGEAQTGTPEGRGAEGRRGTIPASCPPWPGASRAGPRVSARRRGGSRAWKEPRAGTLSHGLARWGPGPLLRLGPG